MPPQVSKPGGTRAIASSVDATTEPVEENMVPVNEESEKTDESPKPEVKLPLDDAEGMELELFDAFATPIQYRLTVPKGAPKSIAGIQFKAFDSVDISKAAVIHVSESSLYDHEDSAKPYAYGVLDRRLGVCDKRSICDTCGKKMQDCPGHFGVLSLALPVFHVGFMPRIVNILNSVCKECSRVLMNPEDMPAMARQFRYLRKSGGNARQRMLLFKSIKEKWKPGRCPHCSAYNGMVQRVSHSFRIVHRRYPTKISKRQQNVITEYRDLLDSVKKTKQFDVNIQKFWPGSPVEVLDPLRVYSIFSKIPNFDIELLDINPKETRPESFIVRNLTVPPVCIRPSVPLATSDTTNEDDLTMKLREMNSTNESIRSKIASGVAIEQVQEQWDFLQNTVGVYFNSEISGYLPASSQEKHCRSLAQRLKGKQGRFRGNLSGKRVNFSGRTVISPDPNVGIDQVVLPERVCKILTFPERVNKYNKKYLKSLIRRGPDKHPGANIILKHDAQGKLLRSIRLDDDKRKRRRHAQQLGDYDIVERHLHDDDLVLFNRQPSLHTMSIMCHRVKVLPHRTFRFNLCVCSPYNADFDGDEMNIHAPQTYEATAEAKELMSTVNNIITPKDGKPLISCTQDFLSASFLLTTKNQFFDKGQVSQIITSAFDGDEYVEIPPPAIRMPCKLWTGKQIISMILNPAPIRNPIDTFDLELQEANYKGPAKREDSIIRFMLEHNVSREEAEELIVMEPPEKVMCFRDGYVVIRKSELLSGNIGKKTLGGGSKDSLFFVLHTILGAQLCARMMLRFTKCLSRWLTNKGFSIGIEDVTPDDTLYSKKEELVHEGYKECDDLIRDWKAGRLIADPGCTTEETLEAKINKRLSEVRGTTGQLCLEQLPWTNSPLIMSLCGSKGSKINISQMVACVGQQTVSGKRAPEGFIDRTLPHFPMYSREPDAKGFVANSFYSGMVATEMFFHTMAGREGLVDTAVKTAETGYMQRRLMKSLDDLSVKYDGSVRASTGRFVQPKYGDDMVDPKSRQDTDNPIHYDRLLTTIKNTYPDENEATIDIDHFEAIKRDLHKYFDGLDNEFDVMGPEHRFTFFKFLDDISDRIIKVNEIFPDLDEYRLRENLFKITEKQLRKFIERVLVLTVKTTIDPGTACGALAAQSIGEPATQMTLKTFHFAGVASMNVTLGVPRIKEIINATLNISTPIINAGLCDSPSLVRSSHELTQTGLSRNPHFGQSVKARLLVTRLKHITQRMDEVYSSDGLMLRLFFDLDAMQKSFIELSPSTIKDAIIKQVRVKDIGNGINIMHNCLEIKVPDDAIKGKVTDIKKVEYSNPLFTLNTLKANLPDVIIQGIPTISRVVLHANDDGVLDLVVEGVGLQSVLNTIGVDFTKTKTNSVLEMAAVLGIEAARQTIINEITYTLDSHGMKIDPRHIKLLAEQMCWSGEVLGITRFGLAKFSSSPIMLASFEQTNDHLFDAAGTAAYDDVCGVTERIIIGGMMPLGTTMFDVCETREFDFDSAKNGKYKEMGPNSTRTVFERIKAGEQ
ncbi:hypothetical protein PCE1_004707 [Barthelona sp. PCE]